MRGTPKSVKYTFTIAGPTIAGPAGADGDSHAARREKLILESRAGESDRHIALKALAYVLFRDRTGGLPLRVEQGVGQRHKPDLVATEPDLPHPVRLWIDCGAIEPRRLACIIAANPAARIVVVKPTRAEAAGYARAFLPHTPRESHTQTKHGASAFEASAGSAPLVFGFDDAFFDAVRQSLRSRNDWRVRALPDFAGGVSPAHGFALQINDEPERETALHRFPLASGKEKT